MSPEFSREVQNEPVRARALLELPDGTLIDRSEVIGIEATDGVHYPDGDTPAMVIVRMHGARRKAFIADGYTAARTLRDQLLCGLDEFNHELESAKALGFASVEECRQHQLWLNIQAEHRANCRAGIVPGLNLDSIDLATGESRR